MSYFTLLGVGSGIPDADRDYTSLVWHGTKNGQQAPLLIDTTSSPYRHLLKAGIEPVNLAGVLLTHSHCDHICGLPSLIFSSAIAGRRSPLPIYGLPCTLEIVKRILEAFRLEQYAVSIDWRPFQAGDSLPGVAGDGWNLQTTATIHNRPCVALRFDNPSQGRRLVHSSDTAPSDAVVRLAQGAEVLIHEATVANSMPGKHCCPREAGAIAAAAGAKSLVLVHYSPRWTMPKEDALNEVRRGGFNGPVRIGHMGMRVGYKNAMIPLINGRG